MPQVRSAAELRRRSPDEASSDAIYVAGLFVGIKNCSAEEARNICERTDGFRGGHRVGWRSEMRAWLGTGGKVQEAGSTACRVKTPDGRACWTWPIELLDPLRCNGGHELRIAPRPSQGRCDGCCSRISTGDSAHRCEDCDFDLCAQCAEKQATWFEGQHVKIRAMGSEEAARLQRSGWESSMSEDLGKIKKMEGFYGSGGWRCCKAGRWHWMLGLLEAVRCPDRCPDGHELSYAGHRHHLVFSESYTCDMCGSRFTAPAWFQCRSCDYDVCNRCLPAEQASFQEVSTQLQVGSIVRVRDEVSPRYGWGGVQRGEHGRIVLIEDDGDARIDFPSHSGWSGHVDDIELCEEQQQESEAGESRGAFPILAREVSNQIGESGDAESPQYGGHDEEWLDEELASQFKCLICHLVCRDAVMHACRAIFCESCWNFSHASDDRCPSCRERERPAQQAYQQQWDIGKLQMICSKCGDSFPLAEKPKHSDECSHRETTCSECGMQVNLRHLEMHQEEECEARPVPCEVCGQKIPRSSLAEHMESAWKEHMVALVKEVKMLRTEVKDLRAEVRRQEPS